MTFLFLEGIFVGPALISQAEGAEVSVWIYSHVVENVGMITKINRKKEYDFSQGNG